MRVVDRATAVAHVRDIYARIVGDDDDLEATEEVVKLLEQDHLPAKLFTEAELSEVVGLISRYYGVDLHKIRRANYTERQQIQRRLLVLGIQLEHPDPMPDPRAPEGGSTAALRVAACP